MCQWSCNFTPHQCRSGFSAMVSLRQWYLLLTVRRSTSSSVLPHNLIRSPVYGGNAVAEVFHCGRVPPPPPLTNCPHQCSYKQRGGWLCFALLCFAVWCHVPPLLLKCPCVSPQLFREVRIMKILNHPNIGEFRWEHATALFDSSAT